MATLDEVIHCLAAPSLRRLFQVRKWGVGGNEDVCTETLRACGPRSLLDGSQKELENTTEMAFCSGRGCGQIL
jgi:hypothetical protein